jgi:two-component sensor histidine kinase
MRHRSGNTLTIAKSVIDRTLADDPNRAATLYQRVSVLLNTDNLYEDAKPVGEYLHQVVVTSLKPHGTDRFAIVGDRLRLAPAHSRSFALIFHELVTNAVKYGAPPPKR